MTRLTRLLSIVFLAVPFAFAVVRAVRTGNDLRYVGMAAAAWLGASVIVIARKARGLPTAAFSAAALAMATLLSGAAATLLGARATPGIWAVALGFGLCSTTGCLLHALARARSM